MGQKSNPIGLRLQINRTWDSRWYANKGEYGSLLQEDLKIRETLLEDLKAAAVSKIVIERPHRKCRVSIHTARPGIVIGKKGEDIENLKKDSVKKRIAQLEQRFAGCKVIVGVDRLDYIKGVPQKLHALELFLGLSGNAASEFSARARPCRAHRRETSLPLFSTPMALRVHAQTRLRAPRGTRRTIWSHNSTMLLRISSSQVR